MPLADFKITINDVDKPLAVRVVVHKNLRAMRSAVTQQDNHWFNGKNRSDNTDFLAICQRYNLQGDNVYSTVRFAPPYIGGGLVAHEMAHAAVWLWEIKHEFKEKALTCQNDEWFAWILGELVNRTTEKFYEKGVYVEGRGNSIRDG